MRIRMATPIVLTLLAATACTGAPTPTSVNVALSCVASEETSSLPGWARAGFTPPDQPVVHVNGLRGDILGVVFGDPLHAPHWPTVGTRSFGSPRLGELHSRSTRHLMAPALLSIERLREDLAHRLSTFPRQAAGPSRCPGPGTRTNSPFRTRAHDYTPWNSPSDDGQGP
jgi:hypothetical protein